MHYRNKIQHTYIFQMPASCFQAFIQGGGSSTNSQTNHLRDGVHNDGEVLETPKSRYGRFDRYTVNDSFQTARTGRSESSYGGNSASGGWKSQRKGNVVTNAICRMKPSNQKGRPTQDADDVSYSHRSQVGLLWDDADADFLSSSFIDAGTGAVAAPAHTGDMNMDSRMNSKTVVSGSSTSRSSTSSNNRYKPTEHDSSNVSEESFITAVEEMPTNKKPSAFKGCVPQLKKKRDLHPSNGSGNVHDYTHVMPHIPEGSQLPKFNASMVDEQSEFPQIIFANEGHGHGHDFGPSTGMPQIRPFSSYQRQSNQPMDISRMQNPNHHHHHASHQNFQQQQQHANEHDEHNYNSQWGSNKNASPIKSNREYKHEEKFLDTLANTLTTNYQDLQQNIYELTGKSQQQRLMEQAMNQGRMVPSVVGFTIEDQSDLVSEFGMGSTSGGRYNDNVSLYGSGKDRDGHREQQCEDDYGPSRSSRANRAELREEYGQQWDETQDAHNRRVPRSEIDNRTLQWLQGGGQSEMDSNPEPRKLYDSDNDDYAQKKKGTSTKARRQYQESPPPQNYRRNELSSKSLIDDSVDVDNNEEENDPTYAFGGTGIRETPLALSEGFDDFGLDDRIYTGKYNPTDTFEFDDSMDVNERNRPSSSKHHSNRNKENTFVGMPSPKKVGLQTRPKKSDTLSKWREQHQLEATDVDTERYEGSTASSKSRFSRSIKYGDIEGMPYKITKDDRKVSLDSTQTQKWSNTSHRRYPRARMSTHEEEDNGSHHPKKPLRISPQTVVMERNNRFPL